MNKAKEILKTIELFVNSESFDDFRLLYLHRTGSKLETLEQFVDAVSDKLITIEDLFEERLNNIKFDAYSDFGVHKEEDYWLDNLNHFGFDNYFPEKSKQVESGGVWIKVRTENGYQIHFARKATRKRFFDREAESWQSKVLKETKKKLKLLENRSVPLEDIIESKYDSKIAEYESKSLHCRVCSLIGLQPYELYYWRTKTQKAYVTPCEYEFVDIQEFIDYVQSKNLTDIVKVRSLFTSKNLDKIFYLKSRGISDELAKIMANLEQCYFDVNMSLAMDKFNSQLKESFEVVSN